MNWTNSNLIRRLQSWTDASLSFFYPEVCQVCAEERATLEEGYVGPGCRSQVKRICPPFCERCGLPYEGDIQAPFACGNCQEMELHFVWARSAVAAKGLVLDVIHRYKYWRELWFERFLAGLLVETAAPSLRAEGWDLILPVPLHPLKQSEREFNQAERLARYLSRATGIPCAKHVLRRVKVTRTQTALGRPERMANVRSAFALRHAEPARDKNVVLVDDVLTTGATTSACARLLLQAGARQVCVWTVARGLLH
jgi:competence protein ComFC